LYHKWWLTPFTTKSAGIKEKPLRRAREKLGIIPRKSTFQGGWVWALPGHEDAQIIEGVQQKEVGILDISGHLASDAPTNEVLIQDVRKPYNYDV